MTFTLFQFYTGKLKNYHFGSFGFLLFSIACLIDIANEILQTPLWLDYSDDLLQLLGFLKHRPRVSHAIQLCPGKKKHYNLWLDNDESVTSGSATKKELLAKDFEALREKGVSSPLMDKMILEY